MPRCQGGCQMMDIGPVIERVTYPADAERHAAAVWMAFVMAFLMTVDDERGPFSLDASARLGRNGVTR